MSQGDYVANASAISSGAYSTSAGIRPPTGGPVIVTELNIGLPGNDPVAERGCRGTRSPEKGTLAVTDAPSNGSDRVNVS